MTHNIDLQRAFVKVGLVLLSLQAGDIVLRLREHSPRSHNSPRIALGPENIILRPPTVPRALPLRLLGAGLVPGPSLGSGRYMFSDAFCCTLHKFNDIEAKYGKPGGEEALGFGSAVSEASHVLD